jgi:prepilin-type N-terminal cleavage/methylation domain-containing protein
MKSNSQPAARHSLAFTLIEMLVVIAIIGILASLLLPAINIAKQKALKAKAKLEMNGIVGAIQQYEATYNRLPATNNSGTMPGGPIDNGKDDFTFGLTPGNGIGQVANVSAMADPVNGGAQYVISNSDIIAILMDITNVPVNLNHQKNPQQHNFLSTQLTSSTNAPGVSAVDYQYRDPWGHPYIISLDMGYDGHVLDYVYGRKNVSQQLTNSPSGSGLINSIDANGNGDHYELSGDVMVWSLGADGEGDGGQSAKTGPNNDNVLSWQ